MKHLLAAASSLLCLFAIEGPTQGQVFQWTTGPGANGHFYEVSIAPGGITWAAANAIASNEGGYLATLNTPQENAFVFSIIDSPFFWVNDAAGNSQGPWIGGFQQAGSTEPDGGWQWVNNEGAIPMNNWAAGEPNNANGGEDRLQFFALGLNNRASTWNDERGGSYHGVDSMIIEFVPEPSCSMLILAAAMSFVLIKRRFNPVATRTRATDDQRAPPVQRQD